MTRSISETSPGPDGRPHEQQPKWRRDFPLDAAQDAYVARRDFVKFMVLTSGAFVVGQAWIGAHGIRRRMRPAPPERAIAALADVPIGGYVTFHYPDGEACLLLRPDETTLVAFNQKCTHLHCPVRPQMEAARLNCPCHNAFFDLRTGVPISGPPQRPLVRILLEVREGIVYATGVELRT